MREACCAGSAFNARFMEPSVRFRTRYQSAEQCPSSSADRGL